MNVSLLFVGVQPTQWLRVEDGSIVARGEGAPDQDAPVVAVIRSGSVAWRSFDATALAPAQALVAARIDAADASLGDSEDRHVAVADARDGYVVMSRHDLRVALAELDEMGLRPAAVIPSWALLPVPDVGFVRAAVPGETVLRAADGGLLEDGEISSLVVGEAPVRTLSHDEIETAMGQAAIMPSPNLLQGEFTPRTDWGAEAGYWRRMGIFAAVALALTFAIPLAKWARLVASTTSIEGESASIAAKALGESKPTPDAILRLREKLAERRGGGIGYLATEAAIVRAVQSQTNAELASFGFDADGTARASVRATSQSELDGIHNTLAAAGLEATLSQTTVNQGRPQAEITVRAP
jgi:type II secretion system protein L